MLGLAVTVGGALGLSRLAARVQAVAVAGESMAPALLPGDFLLLRRRSLPGGAGSAGVTDGNRAAGLIVAARVDDQPRLLLKRIIGLPGETVRAGIGVEINGHTLTEPYVSGRAAVADYRAVDRLRPGEYFLLGDLRSASSDSRHFGPVRADQIEATALLRYWPPSRVGLLRSPRRQFRD